MAILLNFIIPEGHLLKMIPLPLVRHQSQKYEILTDTVFQNGAMSNALEKAQLIK